LDSDGSNTPRKPPPGSRTFADAMRDASDGSDEGKVWDGGIFSDQLDSPANSSANDPPDAQAKATTQLKFGACLVSMVVLLILAIALAPMVSAHINRPEILQARYVDGQVYAEFTGEPKRVYVVVTDREVHKANPAKWYSLDDHSDRAGYTRLLKRIIWSSWFDDEKHDLGFSPFDGCESTINGPDLSIRGLTTTGITRDDFDRASKLPGYFVLEFPNETALIRRIDQPHPQ